MEQRSRIDFLHVDNKGSANLESFNLVNNIGQDCHLFSSSNGFLLFRNLSKLNLEEYVVYHPSTKRSWYIIPPKHGYFTTCVGLASHGHHFKLVRIFYLHDYINLGSQVYSSHSEKWGKDSPPFPIPDNGENGLFLGRERSVFVKGALHWLWMDGVLIYHLENGNVERMDLPRICGREQNQCIWESEGRLNLCNVSFGHRIGIWTLERGNWSSQDNRYSFIWTVKHEGILAPPSTITNHLLSFMPFAFNDDFGIAYFMYSKKVFSYNIATEELKEACIRTFEGFDDHAPYHAFPFSYLST